MKSETKRILLLSAFRTLGHVAEWVVFFAVVSIAVYPEAQVRLIVAAVIAAVAAIVFSLAESVMERKM